MRFLGQTHRFLAASLAVLLSPTLGQAAPYDTFRDCDVCPEMIELPLGEFMIGAPFGEMQRGFRWENGEWRLTKEEQPFYNTSEQPIYPVQIDIPFAMGRNEVTYDEWMACVVDGGCNGYVPPAEILTRNFNNDVIRLEVVGTHPIINVSYLDALTYIDWLNEKVGTSLYRLPTEAEWEYAARAGSQTPFAQGMEVNKEQVNYADVAWSRERASGDLNEIVGVRPVQVEELDAANAWGLRHMSGNVSEITMSCFTNLHEPWSRSSLYLENAKSGGRCDRVKRGGDYFNDLGSARVASRPPADDDARLPYMGFRVARELLLLN